MTTPINELQHTIPSQTQNIPVSMEQDDSNSQIVSEILNEINSSNIPNSHINMSEQPNNLDNIPENRTTEMSDQNAQLYDQDPQFNRQIDPRVNMHVADNMNDQEIFHNENNQNNITIDASTITRADSLKEKIIKKIKEPLIVILVSLLMNNQFTNNLLSKYLPKLFGQMVGKSINYISQIQRFKINFQPLSRLHTGILRYTDTQRFKCNILHIVQN